MARVGDGSEAGRSAQRCQRRGHWMTLFVILYGVRSKQLSPKAKTIEDTLYDINYVNLICHCEYNTLKEEMEVPHDAPVRYNRPRTDNTLRPRQNGRHFADDTFKPIFLNENIRISIRISLEFVPKDPINNIPALVQIMAWRRPCDKPSSEPMVVSLPTHICVAQPQWVKIGVLVHWIIISQHY